MFTLYGGTLGSDSAHRGREKLKLFNAAILPVFRDTLGRDTIATFYVGMSTSRRAAIRRIFYSEKKTNKQTNERTMTAQIV